MAIFGGRGSTTRSAPVVPTAPYDQPPTDASAMTPVEASLPRVAPPLFSVRIDATVLADNHRRAWLLGLVVFVVQLPLLGIDLVRLFQGVLATHTGYRYLWYLHLALQALLAVLLATLYPYRRAGAREPTTASAAVVLGGAFVVLAVSAGITLVDQLIHGQATVFLLGATGVALTVYLPLPLSAAIFGSVALATLAAMGMVQPDADVRVGHLINITLVTAIAISANTTLYRQAVRTVRHLSLINDQRRALASLAARDELTGLANRREGDRRIREELDRFRRYERPFSLCMCDIDHFKSVNDRFSHAVGDQVLRHVARLLTEHLRSVDLVVRYGGEEFVIVLPETLAEPAIHVCEKLSDAIEREAWHEIRPGLAVTMSFGVADTDGADDLAAIINAADARLYRAKESGRNRVVGPG